MGAAQCLSIPRNPKTGQPKQPASGRPSGGLLPLGFTPNLIHRRRYQAKLMLNQPSVQHSTLVALLAPCLRHAPGTAISTQQVGTLTGFAEQRHGLLGDGDGQDLFPRVENAALACEEHRRAAVVLPEPYRPAGGKPPRGKQGGSLTIYDA